VTCIVVDCGVNAITMHIKFRSVSDEKLRCRREAARCFVFLITLCPKKVVHPTHGDNFVSS